MKAIIFVRVPIEEMESSDDSYLTNQLTKLRKYAKANNFEILKEIVSKESFYAIEDSGLTGSPEFLEVINLIKSQDQKIFVIHYAEFYGNNPIPHIDKQFRELLSEGKIAIKSYRHPCFIEPENDAKIWRYINLPKFIDLLQTHTLFFTRGDIMRTLDKAEGSLFTKRTLEIHEILRGKKQDEIVIEDPNFSRTAGDILYYDQILNNFNETAIKHKWINCWHMNEDESFAMWKIYSEDFGVCIESTYENLCDSFEDEKWGVYNQEGKNNKIYIGKVDYIDRDKQTIPQDYGFRPVLHKGRQFAYEQELRCIIYDSENQPLNQRAKVNLDKLINKIRINPFAPSWFEASVKNLCEKYGLDPSKVKQSNLN